MRRDVCRLLAGLAMLAGILLGTAAPASAATVSISDPVASAVAAASLDAPAVAPTPSPTPPDRGSVTVDVNGPDGKPSSAIVIMLALTVLSVAPALLLLCTCFTKIFVVFSITRNALGLNSVPPNQACVTMSVKLKRPARSSR